MGVKVRRLRRVATVVFDCDSTLSAVEGIDELAVGCQAEVEALTDAAMRGSVPLEAVYGRRLDLIRPGREQVAALAKLYVERLVPDAVEVVRALQGEGMDVRIMSGGLRPAVLAVGDALGIAPDRIAAVDVHFGSDGAYAGYDGRSPLARSGGKRDLLALWRRNDGGPIMLVGDGATDLEASDVADLFVAYAGVVSRAAVVAGADVVIRTRSLASVLPVALGGAMPGTAASRTLFFRGLSMLGDEYRSHLPTHE